MSNEHKSIFGWELTIYHLEYYLGERALVLPKSAKEEFFRAVTDNSLIDKNRAEANLTELANTLFERASEGIPDISEFLPDEAIVTDEMRNFYNNNNAVTPIPSRRLISLYNLSNQIWKESLNKSDRMNLSKYSGDKDKELLSGVLTKDDTMNLSKYSGDNTKEYSKPLLTLQLP